MLVSAYGLTAGSGIVEALARAKGREIDIRLIVDKTTPCGRNNGIEPLAAAGVPVWVTYPRTLDEALLSLAQASWKFAQRAGATS